MKNSVSWRRMWSIFGNTFERSGTKEGAIAVGLVLVLLVVTCPVATAQLADAEAVQTPQVRAKFFAFYGTNYSDWVVINNTETGPITWKILKNPADPTPGAARISIFNFGVQDTDLPTPGSFTGDATCDPAVARVTNGQHWISPWENQGMSSSVIPWGTSTDFYGRNGDYDGDGIEDLTVLRPNAGKYDWWIRQSSNGQTRVVTFGALSTQTVPVFRFPGADFTGDGRDELVIARVVVSTGFTTWYIGDAVTGAIIWQVNWGNWISDFLLFPSDYTGDGRADIPVWRAGVPLNDPNHGKWFILNGATGTQTANSGTVFGIGDPNFVTYDFPLRGDYDGDGKSDIAVWRPENATFYALASSNGNFIVQQWGTPDDFPLAGLWAF